MRQLIIICLLLCLGVYASQAQQYFNKRYTLHSYYSTISSIHASGNKYYCSAIVLDSNYGVNLSDRLLVLDSVGDITASSMYYDSTQDVAAWHKTIAKTADGALFFGEMGRKCIVSLFDSSGVRTWDTNYAKPICADDYFINLVDLKQTTTGEWVMLFTIRCTDSTLRTLEQHDMLVMKLDSHFHLLSAQQYGDPHRNDIAGRLLVEDDNYLIAGSYNNRNYTSGVLYDRSQIFKIDTAGNMIWNWRSTTFKQSSTIKDIVHTKDGGYVYCGLGNGYVQIDAGGYGTLYYKGWVEKIDSNRSSVWYDTIGSEYGTVPLTSLVELEDSTVVVAGAFYGDFLPPLPANVGHNFACMIKYRPSGTVAWRRKLTHFNDSMLSIVLDMKKTSDNGFILCGTSNDPNLFYGDVDQQGWVIKVDSCGCMSADDPQCQPTKVNDVAIKGGMRLYPNPAHTSVTIEAPEGFRSWEITLLDMLGRTVAHKTANSIQEKLDMSELKDGVYLYNITSHGQHVQSGRLVKQ